MGIVKGFRQPRAGISECLAHTSMGESSLDWCQWKGVSCHGTSHHHKTHGQSLSWFWQTHSGCLSPTHLCLDPIKPHGMTSM